MSEDSDQETVESALPLGGDEPDGDHYVVLARKYRPTDFSSLIGQAAMVRTLTNAFASGRLAHAFILTGVRGVGKTTTARIIAKALNCIGADGAGGPTIAPCGVCEHCRSITEDRHVDVIEMDAASRTGVDDIRDLIDGVRYRPVSARYKIYIVDEVHMLSRHAFNALLKTLEEPPEHVKFVFATTEIRKVPVTVLSRCQRFDLRRVATELLAAHFANLAEAEGARLAPAALALIARAADGSVRDGLSLLDQAIVGAKSNDGAGSSDGEITEEDVRQMLGLADRGRSFDLLDAVFRGAVAEALDLLDAEYAAGADPVIVLQDLLDLTHWLTRVRVTPGAADDPEVAENERVRGREMAESLSMAALSRCWQMLLKGLGEARTAPLPVQAVEMILVRLAYAAELPSPADAVKALSDGEGEASLPSASENAAPVQPPPATALAVGGEPAPAPVAETEALHPPEAQASPAMASPRSFEEVVALADQKNERILYNQLVNDVHLISFKPGLIEIRTTESAPKNLTKGLIKFLDHCTGERWIVTHSQEQGAETIAQRKASADAAREAKAQDHPQVREIMDAFPGARIETVRDISGPPEPSEDS